MRDVVITGVGIVSPIGVGRDEVWTSIMERRSGVRRLPELALAGSRAAFGGSVHDFDPTLFIRPRKSIKLMCREIQLGVAAAELAWRDAGLGGVKLDPDRVGVSSAAGICWWELEELYGPASALMGQTEVRIEQWSMAALKEMHPLWMLKYLPNLASCHIAIRHDARGPTNTVVHEETSSLIAIAEATETIRRGAADVMIAGGSGSRLKLTGMMWRSGARLPAESIGKGDIDPTAICRPFDAGRSGIVNGEGGAQFILESREHAERRGARPLARVAGMASRNESFAKPVRANGSAIRRAITAALEAANMSPADIGHVNAHGISTKVGDAAEARAIRDTFGDVPVTAPKSYFGHLGAGGGAVELAVSLLGMQNELIPPTLNYQMPDRDCPVNVVAKPQRMKQPAFVALNHNSTGASAAVVVTAA